MKPKEGKCTCAQRKARVREILCGREKHVKPKEETRKARAIGTTARQKDAREEGREVHTREKPTARKARARASKEREACVKPKPGRHTCTRSNCEEGANMRGGGETRRRA